MRTKKILLVCLLLHAIHSVGHPMPNTVLLMDVKSAGIQMELQIPLRELQLAVKFEVMDSASTLIQRRNTELRNYILAHLRLKSEGGGVWKSTIQSMKVLESEQEATGLYQELVVTLWAQAPAHADTRHFRVYYDGVVHQVANHKIMVHIRQDWDGGSIGDQPTEVGIIELDIASNQVSPLVVRLGEGSLWLGFQRMVGLGMHHIAEGTDHLLFLLVLLLPATLSVWQKKWATYAGARNSLIRLVKLVTAFTIGHSVTLVLATLSWIQLPQQPVEVVIAFSILITAIHAMKPIFYGKELYIAIGFGFIHGLAFASMLVDLHLEPAKTALSILGFNVGIELMQLLVILMTVPWLLLLSDKPAHKWIRIVGAIGAIVAALSWMLERITLKPNGVSRVVEKIAAQAPWAIVALALVAIASVITANLTPDAKARP